MQKRRWAFRERYQLKTAVLVHSVILTQAVDRRVRRVRGSLDEELPQTQLAPRAYLWGLFLINGPAGSPSWVVPPLDWWSKDCKQYSSMVSYSDVPLSDRLWFGNVSQITPFLPKSLLVCVFYHSNRNSRPSQWTDSHRQTAITS